jgi:hypothetical protein
VNPFAGSRAFRPGEASRFFGREELSRRLADSILGTRCVTVYGPRGAGKTSLLVTSVLPLLAASEDARVVYLDAWPVTADPVACVAHKLHAELLSGPAAPDLTAAEAVIDGAKRAARASSRLMILCLDQLEQLLYPSRSAAAFSALLACIEELMTLPLRPVRVVLSLREDYLGRFVDQLCGRLRMMEQSFRVVPFTVAEVTEIVCRLAAAGEPPQRWSAEEIQPLMLELREHEQPPTLSAEVRLSYVQNFCMELFNRRAAGALPSGSTVERELAPYIERTLFEVISPADLAAAGDPEANRES